VAPYYQPLPDYSNINITGDFAGAGGFATPGLIATTTYQVSDDFNWVKGSHQLQFGVNYLRPGKNSTFCVYCDGLFTVGGQLTGSAMGDFIAGALDSFTDANVSHDNERWNNLGIYAQDSWKFNAHLTINYGLRWEPYFGGSIVHGWVTHFDQNAFNSNIGSLFPVGPAPESACAFSFRRVMKCASSWRSWRSIRSQCNRESNTTSWPPQFSVRSNTGHRSSRSDPDSTTAPGSGTTTRADGLKRQ
jgi:hypothetical protein